ncbi:MAG TPA: heme A synthase [Cytophagales bacterium]|nr:heme A synthase [Cytophagales bacterium]
MLSKSVIHFKKLVFLSLLLLYLLILAGSVVRSTGSGMGCPDWPKCFGQWVPPYDVSQLPLDYKEKFKVGMHHIADFNVFKTWIEYVNRLLGVLVGLSVFVNFVYSFRFFYNKPPFFLFSLLVFVLTCFQGWIGSKVVESNLSKYMITIHMLIALLIVSLTLFLFRIAQSSTQFKLGRKYSFLLLSLSVLTFVQILMGTQVRQEIDTIALKYNDLNRENWVGELGIVFMLHRILAISIISFNAFLFYKLFKTYGWSHQIAKLYTTVMFLLVMEYAFGVSMVWFSIPFYTQPFHLFIATLVFGIQFYILLLVKFTSRVPSYQM